MLDRSFTIVKSFEVIMMQPLTDYIVYSGPAIRQARKAIGLDLVPFAEKLGVSSGKVSMFETEKRKPTAGDLERMKEVLGKPIVFI